MISVLSFSCFIILDTIIVLRITGNFIVSQTLDGMGVFARKESCFSSENFTFFNRLSTSRLSKP